ncbi:hypothetical protein AURDEDRAFT_109749 [Auricularia subglabra TFB-10046 SS5]|nr:hypothetical protein AURDEDRAFT_109749 [Auricularia subglabra TFB-10046 SS5]
MGESPLSPRLKQLLASLSDSSTVVPPEVKAYRDCVYFNYFEIGLSLQFVPTEGYTLSQGLQMEGLALERLALETIDLYNVPDASPENARAKTKASHYRPYPKFPIELSFPGGASGETALAISPETTGKDIVAPLGEPDRKGGGTGPSSGSIGIWCEWSKLGMMVEFGGDEARGPQAWEKGKDAVWSSLTLFKPKSAS